MKSNTIRVLQVLGILDRGGAETMIMNLYRGIDRNIIQFDFVVHTDKIGAYDAEVVALGGRIYHAPQYKGINHLQYVKWWNQFLAIHKEHKIIHSHIRSTASIFLPIAKQYRRMTIVHSHSTSDGSGVKALVKRFLRRGITRNADNLFACSDVAGQWLFGKKAIKQKPYYILNNAIDSKKFVFDPEKKENIRKQLGLEDVFLMGTVGRIAAPKNPFGMIEIIKSVCELCEDVRFLWIGSGEMEDIVKMRVQEERLDKKIIFTGTRSDIPELLSAIDVFLLPSNWEGLPVSVIEAQASGVPCLLSDNITDMVCITPVAIRLPLHDVSIWREEILKIRAKPYRMVTLGMIKEAGYDIESTTTWLQNFYLKKEHGLSSCEEKSIKWRKS